MVQFLQRDKLMEIKLRDPNIIMKLPRLGSFHQSKLSFLRSFLKEFKNWEYRRDLFSAKKKTHIPMY